MNEHLGNALPAENKPPSQNGETFEEGQILVGKYQIVHVIGQGGIGDVYRVRQLFFDKEFALKVLHVNKLADESHLRRFRLEAKAANTLNHPNLVKVHDFGILESGQPYLVMDLVEGCNLLEYLAKHGPLSVEKAVPLFIQICAGLESAHQQSVVHRDIKPSNIMLIDSQLVGVEGGVKIVDFGIAKLTSDEGHGVQSITRAGEVFGSPLYMSPEQCSGGSVDFRSDIYSLGCVFFEVLTGSPPHIGTNALSTLMIRQTEKAPLMREVSLGIVFPNALEEIIATMLQKAPSSRFQSMESVHRRLLEFVRESEPGEIAKETRVAETNKTAEISKTPAILSLSYPQIFGIVVSTVFISIAGILMAQQVWGVYGHRPIAEDPVAANHHGELTKTAEATETVWSNDIDSVAQRITTSKLRKRKLESAGAEASFLIPGTAKPRTLVFPKASVGFLSRYSASPGLDDRTAPRVEAKGVILTSDGVLLELAIDGRYFPETVVNPSVLTQVDPSAIYELSLSNSYARLITDTSSDPIQQTEASLLGLFAVTSGWSNLKALSLSCFSISDRAVSAMARLGNLDKLNLESVQANVATLAKQRFLQKLKYLRISNLVELPFQRATDVSVDSIIKSLKGSANLQDLRTCDSPVSAAALRNLQSCANLIFMDISAKNADDEFFEELCKIKSLRLVYLRNAALTHTQVDTLNRCTWINQIQLADPVSLANIKGSKFTVVQGRQVAPALQ